MLFSFLYQNEMDNQQINILYVRKQTILHVILCERRPNALASHLQSSEIEADINEINIS